MMLRVCALAVFSALLISGCSSDRESTAEQVAEQFHAGLHRSDGAAVCDLLSADAQKALSRSQRYSCRTEVLQSGLPDTGRLRSAEVFGTAAQVRYDDDVIFLARFPDGWKVTAAGCTAVAGAPYDCTVQAG